MAIITGEKDEQEYHDLKYHIGHDIECVQYGKGENIALECETCGMVLYDIDKK